MNNMLTMPGTINLASSAKSYTGTEENDFADALGIGSARRQREYEAYMSNTAYRRAVNDMKEAGLNPAIMYGNGNAASTPTGAGNGTTGRMMGNLIGIASIFSNTAKVMKQVNDIRTDKELASNAINIAKRIGFRK